MKLFFTALTALVLLAPAARAQTTAFTYQGRLNSGVAPATGSYDFRFQIYNAVNAVVAGPLTNAPVGVTNGLFTVTLDFGANVFDGSTRSLEIGVRTNGDTSAYTVLAPRQALASVPYAIQSVNASNAAALTTPLQATNIAGTIPNALLSTNVAVLTNTVVFTAGVTATNFTGYGFGLSNVPATSLSGTIPDARLSANVALQSNPNLNFAGTVSATNFVGAGHGLTNVPGAFFWVVVSGTNVQAQPNVGYICTNDVSAVTVTLPASPSIGDTFRVAGAGGAGWVIAQNTNQTILAGNLSGSIGASWTARDGSRAWSGVASSADGTKLVATVKGGNIFTSTNSGVNWTNLNNGGIRNWSSVASSADGTRLVAGVGDITSLTGNLYNSVDSGATWTARDSARQWVSVASSADGIRMVASAYSTGGSGGPGIYTSVNSGTNWLLHLAGSFFYDVVSSSDGFKLVGTENTFQIATSTNAGTNWVARDSNRNWTALASSADGTRLVAAVNSSQLYLSSDSGVTWAAVNPAASLQWTALASSADGSRLVAVAFSGEVYISTDSGATWAQHFGLPVLQWSGVACSADGTKLVLVPNGGQIYTSSQGSTTTGTTGYLSGARLTAIELEYAGNGTFIPLSHEGTLRAY
jgi:hypothetical protein